MSKRLWLVLLAVFMASAVSAKTALDLMVEGRFGEAKAILDTSNVSPRYQLLYYAMIEGDAARACSLYQVVCIRYPNSDCDSLARVRLDQAQEMGFVVVPIAEWSQASHDAHPLALHRGRMQATEAAIQVPGPVSPPVVTPVPAPTMPVVVAPPPVVVSVPASPAVSEPQTPEEEPVSVRDTMITREKVPEPAASPPPSPPATREIISAPAEAQPVPPPVQQSEPPKVIEQPVAAPPPVDSVAQEAKPAPDVEQKEPPVEAAPQAVSNSLSNNHSNGPWYIQVGAFANFDNAHRLALALKNAGYPVKLVPRDSAKGKLLQVRVGGYATRDELPPVAGELKEKFSVPTAYVSE